VQLDAGEGVTLGGSRGLGYRCVGTRVDWQSECMLISPRPFLQGHSAMA